MAGDREKALATGCDDFDTKPVEFDRLLAKIEQALAPSCRTTSAQALPQSSDKRPFWRAGPHCRPSGCTIEGSPLEADIDQIADAYGSTKLAAPTLSRTVGIALMQGKTG
jgi:DNA-binding response OmpR family regulator